MHEYNLYSEAFKNEKKFLLTLSVAQVQWKRIFNIRKYIKNQLRNRLNDALNVMYGDKDLLMVFDN